MSDQVSYQEKVILPRLPLATYQELATHLRQLPGVETKLIPQNSLQFDYQESQVGGLILTYDSLELVNRLPVTEILKYYSDRYCSSCLERITLE